MTKIKEVFDALAANNKKALIPFITAGHPHPELTVQLMHALVRSGADIIELGIPFSDPMADGPVIQKSSEIALAHGVTLKSVLEMVTEFRGVNQHTPVVLMGYANPIERMGIEHFSRIAAQAGVNGVLIVDYPPEECSEFNAALQKVGIDTIFLLAPTSTEERISQVAAMAKGYVYYVSLKGVTGSGALDLTSIQAAIPRLKQHIKVPVGVGFGIRDAQTARLISEVADAVVIGSKIIQEIDSVDSSLAIKSVETFISGVRKALDE